MIASADKFCFFTQRNQKLFTWFIYCIVFVFQMPFESCYTQKIIDGYLCQSPYRAISFTVFQQTNPVASSEEIGFCPDLERLCLFL